MMMTMKESQNLGMIWVGRYHSGAAGPEAHPVTSSNSHFHSIQLKPQRTKRPEEVQGPPAYGHPEPR